MKNIQPICPVCHRKFKTESGLKWHLFQIHEWRDVRKILGAPSPEMLAKIAYEEEIMLAVYAKQVGMDSDAMKRLIQQRFGAKQG
jgi:hypothetical protein